MQDQLGASRNLPQKQLEGGIVTESLPLSDGEFTYDEADGDLPAVTALYTVLKVSTYYWTLMSTSLSQAMLLLLLRSASTDTQ